MDITQNLIMQYVLLLGSLFGVIISILLLRGNLNKKGYIIAPLTYFINSLLFYLTVHLIGYNIIHIGSQQLLLWSTILRLHSLIILLTYVIVEPSRRT